MFRSRLEARWAAFFDLIGLPWDYEPFDLDGWAPDFVLNTRLSQVLVEVKPFDLSGYLNRGLAAGKFTETLPMFSKALNWRHSYQICLLGVEPPQTDWVFPIGLPVDPPLRAEYTYDDIFKELTFNAEPHGSNLWYEAGSTVQWGGRHAA